MEEKTKLSSIFKLLVMVRFFWFFVIFIFFQTVFAQDIDIYKHQKNSNFQWLFIIEINNFYPGFTLTYNELKIKIYNKFKGKKI